MSCKKGHRNNPIFNDLLDSQAGDGRHKCAGCALEHGFIDGFNNIAYRFNEISNSLPDSQAKMVRHKNTEEAYAKGFNIGKSLAKN